MPIQRSGQQLASPQSPQSSDPDAMAAGEGLRVPAGEGLRDAQGKGREANARGAKGLKPTRVKNFIAKTANRVKNFIAKTANSKLECID